MLCGPTENVSVKAGCELLRGSKPVQPEITRVARA